MHKRWRELAEAYGGVGRLADSLGVHRNTLADYGTGAAVVPKTVAIAVASLAAQKKVRSPC